MNSHGDRVLLADVGGTHARFALADPAASIPLLDDSVREFAVTDFGSLAEAAGHYLQTIDTAVARGVFAVAGRVDGDEVRMTNHSWVISRTRTQQALQLDALQLVNDFHAQSMALHRLGAHDVAPIGIPAWSPDRSAARTYAILGPGTGLGVGALIVRDGQPHALATEGGHVGFAPGTPEEIAILERLTACYGRVSNERLISGDGLVNLHRALSQIAGEDGIGEDGDPLQPADITARAAQGDPRSARAIDIFCAVFGAIAGDLVLTLGAWDGVFLSGGLVPRLLPVLRSSGFRQRFEDKGRYAPAMARVPTMAVLHPYPGLLGAAALASDGLTIATER